LSVKGLSPWDNNPRKKQGIIMTKRQPRRASRCLKNFALLLIAGLTLTANAQRPARTLNPVSRFRQQPLASFNSDTSTKLPKFLAHRDYLAADGPHGIATADLNGDGILDLVLNDGNSAGVSVLLGNRDGSFQPFALFDCGCQFPFDVVVADFNGDGKSDVAETSPNGVSILLGDGAGNLGAPLVLTAGISPERVVAADLNGDHKMDLAVTNLGSNTVSIFLGRGDGTFAAATDVTVGMGPSGIAAGDFNRDGKLDLAVADSGTLLGQNKGPNPNTLAILLGDGKGGVSSTTFIPVEKTPQQVLVRDLNKDKKLDVLVSTFAKGDITELPGNGDGTFQSARIFHAGTRADAMRVADFNADGKPDLLVSNGSLSTVSILFGDGAGNFGRATSAPSGRTVTGLATGDFNHDGKTDYITANFDSNTVSVVLGKGNGKFVDLGPALPIGTDFPNQTITADFNGDGLPDLALVDTGSNKVGQTVEILLGKSNGGFGPAKAFAAGTQPEGLVATDFNHDGHLDLIVSDFGTFPSDHGGVSLLLGKGDGSFRSPASFAAGDFPVGIASGDFNGDGNPDVVVADFGTSVGVAAVTLLLGDGKNGFAPAQNVFTFPEFTVFASILSGDFNNDGKQDIAYISSLNDNRVSVQFGNGDGTFQPAIPVVVRNVFTTIFFSFAAGDFNNDGIPDFAVEEGGTIEIVLNDGNGHFTSAGVFGEQSGASFGFVPALVLADFNGDGVLDVAAPDGFAETMAVLLGNGDGTLGPATLFGGGLTDSATAVNFAGFQPSVVLGTPNQGLVVRNPAASK
jgi:hypothetical protein